MLELVGWDFSAAFLDYGVYDPRMLQTQINCQKDLAGKTASKDSECRLTARIYSKQAPTNTIDPQRISARRGEAVPLPPPTFYARIYPRGPSAP